MIPFSSQRGLGQDLATHLLNEHDNEEMEVAEIRGAIASDLNGAFAEWEAQAHALTKCKNYLYSLSINPDPEQEPLTREEYQDYIKRTEEKLGLTDQPRAIVYHRKYGREHCHVVWSRVDVENEKAIQLAFDREKLMMVTREFAHDHGLSLPDGYYKGGKEGKGEKGEQQSLYEMHKERSTGFTKEEHQEIVTDAWRASDSAKAFVQALSEKGYMLATGNRPYVLVDYYGGMHSLPKMIADKSVRTNDIREFLDNDYPLESLPTVDQARVLISKHRSDIEVHAKAENYNEELYELKTAQEKRRAFLEGKKSSLKQGQHDIRVRVFAEQKQNREFLHTAQQDEVKQVNQERVNRQPGKLAKAFGVLSGYSGIKKIIYKYQDRKRDKAFQKATAQLKEEQTEERNGLKRAQEMQRIDVTRQLNVLGKLEKREMNSFEEDMTRESRIKERRGLDHMPPLLKQVENDQDYAEFQSYVRNQYRDSESDRGR